MSEHNGKRMLTSPADFDDWILEEVRTWAGDALEDAGDVEILMREHGPTSYPVCVCWKGVRAFHYWFVYPSDFTKEAA